MYVMLILVVFLQLLVQCEASYAFSAVGALEGARALSTGSFVALSEQNVLDCSGNENANFMSVAIILVLVIANNIITSVANYVH